MVANSKFLTLDQNFEHFLDTVLVEVSESELTPEKRAARRQAADADDLAFCKIYYPSIFHLEWNDAHRWIASLKHGIHTLSGFRKSGKSAATYVMKALKPLARRMGGIVNINARTMEISNERTAALKRLMLRNKMLCYDYDIELQQDLKGYYIINNTFLIAGSYSTGLRNLVDDDFKRIKIAINDDLYNKNTVTSQLDNERVTNFVEAEVAGQLEDDALCITMGNSISEDCPIVRLKGRRPDNHFSIPALDENGESTWKDYKSTAEWQQFKREIPLDVWLGEYMDKPAVKGDVFDLDWLRSIHVQRDVILASISAADPSHGQSPSACDKGLATVSITRQHQVIVQDIYLRKEDYVRFFDYTDAVRNKTPHWKALLFENDFSQWNYAYPYYLNWMDKRRKVLPIITHYSKDLATQYRGADKESRILNLVHPLQTGMLLFAEAVMQTRDFEKFRTQYIGFGKAREKLDGLDALATAYIMVFRYIETGGFKSLKERIFGRERWFANP